MQPWTGAIIEWLNCLGLHKTLIKTPGDLQDKEIYTTIVSKLTCDVPSSIPYEQVSNFIKKEYPEFLLHHNPTEKIPDHVYTASLLLLSTSQNPSFHRPMCNLRNDTQILIKKYLESLLPYGNTITREILTSTISELSDSTPRTPPVTPKDHPLRNFFTSPAAHSAHRHRILNEKTRQLRELKADLETTKYEKHDLQEDLKNREEKIQNLQKKLHDKNQELKALKAERFRESSTPQSTRKNVENGEGMLKREIQKLEEFNSGLQSQLDCLEDEKEELLRRLMSKERLNEDFKEKLEIYERNLESLGIQVNQKSSELLDLRLQNEELRSYIKDMQRSSINADQSFEIDSVSRALSPTPGFNTSEALSSIVDIQLQEAREESLKLKSEVESLNLRLDEALKDCEGIKIVEDTLRKTEIELIESKNELKALEMNLWELKELKEELESQVDEEKRNFGRVSLENEDLMEKLGKLKADVEEMREKAGDVDKINEEKSKKIEILESESEQLNLKLSTAISDISQLKELQENLENQLTLEQESSMKLITEKSSLERELSNKVRENCDFLERIGNLEVEVNKTVEELQELENLHGDLGKTHQETLEKVERLEGEVLKVNDDFRKSNLEISDLKMMIDDLEGQLIEEKRNIKSLLHEKSILENKLSSSEGERGELLEKLSKLEESLDFSNKTIEKIQKKSDDFEFLCGKKEKTILELEKLHGDLDKTHQETLEKVERLEGEVLKVNDDFRKSNLEISDLKMMIDDLEGQLTEEKRNIKSLLHEKSILENELSSSEGERGELLEKLSKLEESLDFSNKTIEKIQKKSDEFEFLCGKKEKTILELEKLHGDLGKAHQETLEKVERLEGEVLKVNDDFRKSNLEISDLKLMIDDLEGQLTEEKRNIKSLLHEKSILENELFSSEGERGELLEKLSKLEESLDFSNKTIEKIQKKSDEFEFLCGKKEKTILELEKLHGDLDKTHQETLEKVERLEGEVLKVNDDFRKSNLEISDLKLMIDDLEGQLTEEKRNIKSLLHEKSILENELSSSEGERGELLEKLSKLEESLDFSNKTIEKIQKKSDDFEFLCEKRQKEIEDQQNEILELKNKVKEVFAERKSLEESLEKSNSEILELKKIEENLKNQFEGEKKVLLENFGGLEGKLRNVLEEIEESEKKNWEAVEKINLMNFEIEKLNSEVRNSDFERGSLLNDVNRLSGDILELKRVNEGLESQLKGIDESNKELLEEKSNLIDELLNLKEENNNLFDKLSFKEQKLIQSNDKIEELKIYSDELQERCNFMTSEIENLNSKLEKIIFERNSLEINLNNLNDEFINEKDTNKSEKSSLIFELSKLKEENDDLVKNLSLNEEKLMKMQNNFDKIEEKEKISIEKIILLNSEIDNLNFNLEKIISDRNSIQNDLTEIENKLRNSEIEINSQNDFIETLKTEKSLLISELSRLKQENEHLVLNLNLNKEKLEESTKKMDHLESYCQEKSEKIDYLTSKIENLSLKLTEIISSRDSLQNNFTKVTEELEIRKLESKEYERKLEESKELMENSKNRHEDEKSASKEFIKSLEKRLLASESIHETLEINNKSKEDKITILNSKIEELSKEKIESEFKLKEIIKNLQEIRGSQDAVMETQSKALRQKNDDLEALEKEYSTLKQSLEDKIHLQALKIEELSSELKESIENSSKTVEHLQETLKTEKERLIFLNQQLYKTEEEKCKIIKISKIFSSRLSNLFRIIDNDPINSIIPEEEEVEDVDEVSDDPDVQELSKSVKNLLKLTKSSEKTLFSFLEEKKKLLQELEDEKINAERDLKEKMKIQDLFETVLSQKQEVQCLLNDVIASRDEIDKTLSSIHHNWTQISMEKQSLLMESSSACDEVKHLDVKKTEIEELMNKIKENHYNSFQYLLKCISRVFSWSNDQIQEFSSNICLKEDKSDEEEVKIDLISEESFLKTELKNNGGIKEDLRIIEMKIDEFKEELNSYEVNLKSGVVKREPTAEEKLQNQVDRLSKEKKDIKEKLDALRVRSAKLEKNMDELRCENKKMKSDVEGIGRFEGIIDDLKRENEVLERENVDLKRENEDLKKENEVLKRKNKDLKKIKEDFEKKLITDDFDDKLKQVHDQYGQKLEKIKEKMKIAYNEQATKMQIEQERIIKEKTGVMKEKMEAQCRKYVEDIEKYKAHVKDMSTQYWDVGEKLLAEKQEKESALARLRELQRKHQSAIAEASQMLEAGGMRSTSLDRGFEYDRRDFGERGGYRAVQVIEEQTTTRRQSVKSIQAMGNAFKAEDEDEIFDNVYLADLKEGQFRAIEPQTDFDRLSELRMRNSLCRPHLKSSYAVETHLHPVTLTEEDIKSGPHEDLFNDSLSQSLLPGQKVKKKDRTQTSYKRPGPPTPSKNGGRLSLQGNEYKSPNSRILRDKNGDRRTTTTPKRLKDFFGTSLSRRHDENAPGTPKGRRLSHIFRKPKTERS